MAAGLYHSEYGSRIQISLGASETGTFLKYTDKTSNMEWQ